MSRPLKASFESRRRKELLEELLARSRAWLPEWQPRDETSDFGRALFEIAARLGTEITQRLDRAPEKTFRGFLDWLGVRGQPGRSARLPVVFDMRAGSDPVEAAPPVKLQALDVDPPVMFETQDKLLIVPGRIASLVAAAPDSDAYYKPVPGLLTLGPSDASITEWQLVSDVGAQGTQLQLQPELGLEPGLELRERSSGLQYTVTAAENGIVTIEPSLGSVTPQSGAGPGAAAQGLSKGAVLERVTQFTPFSSNERNRQEHALYIGADNALNVETPAVIEIQNGVTIPGDAKWQYSSKGPAGDEPAWLDLAPVVHEGRLFLRKPAGSIEKSSVEGQSSRWLRATRASGSATGPATASGLRLLINCRPDTGWPWEQGVPPAPVAASDRLKLEGVANTAPLVLDVPFYPLGREPRVFDAFYLGSKEAFSKPDARARLAFKMGSTLSGAPAAASFGSAQDLLVMGIGGDGRLHRAHSIEEAVPPPPHPLVRTLESSQPSGAGSNGVVLSRGARPGAAAMGSAVFATAASGDEVWLGYTFVAGVDTAPMTWTSLGPLPPLAPNAPQARKTYTDVVRTMLTCSEPVLHGYATRKGELLERQIGWGGSWHRIDDAIDPGVELVVATIVPVLRHDVRAGQNEDHDGIAIVTEEGRLYVRESDGAWRKIGLAPLLDHEVYPLIVRDAADALFCFARGKPDMAGEAPIFAFDLSDAANPRRFDAHLVGHGFDFVIRNKTVVALFAVATNDGQTRAVRWDPFGDGSQVLDDPPPGEKFVEAPLVSGDREAASVYVVFPGPSGAFFARRLEPALYETIEDAAVTDAALFKSADDWTNREHLWVDLTPEKPTLKQMVSVLAKPLALPATAQQALVLARPIDRDDQPFTVDVYKALHEDLRTGTQQAPKIVELAAGDTEAADDGWLYIESGGATRMYRIDHVQHPAPPAKALAHLVRALPAELNTFEYRNLSASGSLEVTTRPSVDLTGVRAQILAKLGPGSVLHFTADLEPGRQVITSMHAAQKRAILGQGWIVPPTEPYEYDLVVDAALSPWFPFIPPLPQNPALSWEYWNGTGWWQIRNVQDDTRNFLQDGDVTFCVPPDLQPTDVVGRTNHWIRARLVGGDYGQESITIISTPVEGGTGTKQTVERHPEDVQAPIVAELEATYRLCCPVMPDHVLTRDSGAVRDQTDANRTGGAVVEYFVPLATTLAGLAPKTGTLLAARKPGGPPVPACIDCSTGAAWSATAQAEGPNATTDAGGRALYLGIDGPLRDGPISILFLVDEHVPHDDPFPLRMDVLTEQGFAPAIVQDSTRGLTESGVVVFTLDAPPPQWSLFGEARRWLRLRPRANFDDTNWQPTIRAAYLNATFARAAETQTLELLGSSDGAPHQQVTLARPPVIAGSLRLRVRERLGDEDIAALRAGGADVVPKLGTRDGPWVLWTEVNDPDDAAAGDRVYAFDDEAGDIRFGDGLHGRIPPAGRDCIIAEVYRSGGGEHANAVKAWGQLNVITPVQGVERVAAPEGAAGGSDVQDAATTVRFAPANLAVRGRAITLHDLEVLALQYSRDVAQVRALPATAGARVVVVMRGRDPRPSPGVLREMSRYLTERSTPTLAQRGALTILGPALRSIRVDLVLTIDAIENSGTVSRAAADQVRALLDPAGGGLDRTGWRLAAIPSTADLAAVLADVEHLDGVDDAKVLALGADGTTLALEGPLRANELVVLAEDGVRVALLVTDAEATA